MMSKRAAIDLRATQSEFSYDGGVTWECFPEVEYGKTAGNAYPRPLPYPGEMRTRLFFKDGTEEVVISRERGVWVNR